MTTLRRAAVKIVWCNREKMWLLIWKGEGQAGNFSFPCTRLNKRVGWELFSMDPARRNAGSKQNFRPFPQRWNSFLRASILGKVWEFSSHWILLLRAYVGYITATGVFTPCPFDDSRWSSPDCIPLTPLPKKCLLYSHLKGKSPAPTGVRLHTFLLLTLPFLVCLVIECDEFLAFLRNCIFRTHTSVVSGVGNLGVAGACRVVSAWHYADLVGQYYSCIYRTLCISYVCLHCLLICS